MLKGDLLYSLTPYGLGNQTQEQLGTSTCPAHNRLSGPNLSKGLEALEISRQKAEKGGS